MTFVLTMLFYAAILFFAFLLFQGALNIKFFGLKWDLGPRDTDPEPSVLQKRTDRTIANSIEGMMIFVPLVLIAHLSGIHSLLTVWGAGLYMGSRIIYCGLYLSGVPVMRSFVWTVGIIGKLMIAFEIIRVIL